MRLTVENHRQFTAHNVYYIQVFGGQLCDTKNLGIQD